MCEYSKMRIGVLSGIIFGPFSPSGDAFESCKLWNEEGSLVLAACAPSLRLKDTPSSHDNKCDALLRTSWFKVHDDGKHSDATTMWKNRQITLTNTSTTRMWVMRRRKSVSWSSEQAITDWWDLGAMLLLKTWAENGVAAKRTAQPSAIEINSAFGAADEIFKRVKVWVSCRKLKSTIKKWIIVWSHTMQCWK